jgi:hypothetical protein
MQLRHRLRAAGDAILEAFLDLLCILGFAQQDQSARSGWHPAIVTLLSVLFLVAILAGLVPWGFLEARASVGAWLAVVVIGTFGLFLVTTASAASLIVLVLLCCGRRVTAVARQPGPGGDPRFQFAGADGQPHEVSGAVVSVMRSFEDGEEVPLLYLPGRPGMFVVDRLGDKCGAPLFVLTLGLILLLGPAVYVLDLTPFLLQRIHLFGGLLAFLVGAIFSALAVTSVVQTARFRRKAARGEGVIVEARRQREAWADRARQEGKTLLTELPPAEPGESEGWVVAVEFDDAIRARRREVVEVWKQNPPRVGDVVPVRYDPGRPSALRLDTSLEWLGPLALGAVGAGGVALGVLLWCGVLR